MANKKHSKEVLRNEELLNELEISINNSMALQGCIEHYIDNLQQAFKDNALIYHLARLKELESINTMLLRELNEVDSTRESLYKLMEAQQ